MHISLHRLVILCVFTVFLIPASSNAQKSKPYFPPPGKWEEKNPLSLGMDTAKLRAGVQFAITHESNKSYSVRESQFRDYGNEPFWEPVGPLGERGAPAGLVIYKGYIVARWGDCDRVEITNSVTKSFLSALVGLAVQDKRINEVNDTVYKYLSPVQLYQPADTGAPVLLYPFETKHNRLLTWQVMLQQSSDWEGTLWDKPEWADRPDKDSSTWRTRPRKTPGSVFEYNDVRVNALALATTFVWRKSLPLVLKERIMDPIGASGRWQWFGYRNSWIVLDGQPVQSVSGGGHWGGGMFISAMDMARFGLLTLRKGNWNGKQLIPEKWIEQSKTPSPANENYGYMNFFLNPGKKFYKDLPENSFIHIGNGANIIFADPDHDLLVVSRWIRSSEINNLLACFESALPQ